MGAAALRGFPLAGEGEHDHPHSGEDSAQLAIVGPAQPSKKGIPMLRVCPRTLGPAHGSAALVCRPQSVDAVEAMDWKTLSLAILGCSGALALSIWIFNRGVRRFRSVNYVGVRA